MGRTCREIQRQPLDKKTDRIATKVSETEKRKTETKMA